MLLTQICELLSSLIPHKPGDATLVFDVNKRTHHLLEVESHGIGLEIMVDKVPLWNIELTPGEVKSWQKVYKNIR